MLTDKENMHAAVLAAKCCGKRPSSLAVLSSRPCERRLFETKSGRTTS